MQLSPILVLNMRLYTSMSPVLSKSENCKIEENGKKIPLIDIQILDTIIRSVKPRDTYSSFGTAEKLAVFVIY